MRGTAVIRLQPANRQVWLQEALLCAGLLAWLAYTRVFWPLKAAHASIPPCPFYLVTGHPCPLCGGTRSFAAMWNGDVAAAARFYPLGPGLFLLTLAVAAGLLILLAARRSIRVVLPLQLEKRAYLAGGTILAASWALKLFWLGN